MFREIPGIKDYMVNEYGEVLSLFSGTTLNPSPNKEGYLKVTIYYKSVFVHTLVLLAFRGDKPSPDMVCRHLDGNPTNNNIDNIVWGTEQENHRDRVLHGNQNTGKLSLEQVREIRSRLPDYNYRGGLAKLGREYNVTGSLIGQIKSGKVWG